MPVRLPIDRLAGLDIQRVKLATQQPGVVPVVLVQAHEQSLDVVVGFGGQFIQVAEHRFFQEVAVWRPQPEIDVHAFGGPRGQLEQCPLK
ncbi:hypothetical protein D3C86_1743490 [compost metagenome]